MTMNIRRPVLAIALALALPTAHALTIDAKGLARYDISYVQCEARFPDLKGKRDDAYLAMWRTRPTPELRKELATARKGGATRSRFSGWPKGT